MLVDKFGTLSSEDLEKLIAPNADCLKLVPGKPCLFCFAQPLQYFVWSGFADLKDGCEI